MTAVVFNKELDPIQKLFVDKIREYKAKRQTSGGPVDTGPEYQQELDKELYKLKQMYGGGDMNTFPTFKFQGQSNHKLNLGDYCRQRIFTYIFFWGVHVRLRPSTLPLLCKCSH